MAELVVAAGIALVWPETPKIDVADSEAEEEAVNAPMYPFVGVKTLRGKIGTKGWSRW